MKKILLVAALILSSIPAYGTEFKLIHFDRYGESPGMELSLRPNNGNKLSEIFNILELTRDEFYIRLIGETSDKTNSEILQFYRDNFPNEWNIALLKASGKLHDPSLAPLADVFDQALKSTTMYSSLIRELKERGYKVVGIEFEKFSIEKNGVVPFPDVHLRCVKDF